MHSATVLPQTTTLLASLGKVAIRVLVSIGILAINHTNEIRVISKVGH